MRFKKYLIGIVLLSVSMIFINEHFAGNEYNDKIENTNLIVNFKEGRILRENKVNNENNNVRVRIEKNDEEMYIPKPNASGNDKVTLNLLAESIN